jgi:hypothetical protein
LEKEREEREGRKKKGERRREEGEGWKGKGRREEEEERMNGERRDGRRETEEGREERIDVLANLISWTNLDLRSRGGGWADQ